MQPLVPFVAHLVRHGRAWRLALLCAIAAVLAPLAHASELSPGSYFWYVPEHEQHAKTEFYTQPTFDSAVIKFARTQRFKLVGARRGWAHLDFDNGTQAYVHVRLLHPLVYEEGTVDPWAEFKRASVFSEPPEKIAARLKTPSPEVTTAGPRTPVWKRYKDGWSINQGRSQPGATERDALPGSARPAEKKGRTRYSPLPPVEPEPPSRTP
jgi:hypothetical protein